MLDCDKRGVTKEAQNDAEKGPQEVSSTSDESSTSNIRTGCSEHFLVRSWSAGLASSRSVRGRSVGYVGQKCFKETRNMLSSSRLKKMLKVKPRAIGKDIGVGTFDEK